MYQGFSYECLQSNLLSHFSNKTYVLGTQKNRLNIDDFTLKNCVYLDYDLYSMQICYTSVHKSYWMTWNITGNS